MAFVLLTAGVGIPYNVLRIKEVAEGNLDEAFYPLLCEVDLPMNMDWVTFNTPQITIGKAIAGNRSDRGAACSFIPAGRGNS